MVCRNCLTQCMMDSTSPACRQCVDDKCTAAFETCSGLSAVGAGTATTVAPAATTVAPAATGGGSGGKCTVADKTKFAASGGMDALQTKCGNDCGVKALSGPGCVTECVERDGYSNGCASCAGESASCVIKCVVVVCVWSFCWAGAVVCARLVYICWR